MKIKALRAVVLAAAVCSLCTLRGNADDQAAPSKAPAVFSTVAFCSASDLATTADELGVPLPASMTPAGIEQAFPFLGQGGLNADLPFQMDFIAGEGVANPQRAIIYLPATAGHAPIKDFLKNGQKLGTDAAVVNNVPFRRAGDYLMFGGVADVIESVRPGRLSRLLRDHPLMYLEYDAKKLRELEPALLEKFKKDTVANSAKPKTQAEAAGQSMAINAMIDGLDHLVVRLDKKNDAFKLTTLIQPCPQIASRSWNKPGLPDGLVARLDWQPPANWAKDITAWFRKTVGDKELFEGSNVDDANREKAVVAIQDAMDVLLGGDEASYGMGLSSDDKVVFYAASQSSAPRNVHADFQRLTDEITAAKSANSTKATKLTEYVGPTGEKVERLTLGEEVVIDSTDRGGIRFTTVSNVANKGIESLLASKASGALNGPAAGTIDLLQMMKMINAVGDSKGALAESDLDLLKKVFGTTPIEWTVTTTNDELGISVNVPVSLIKNTISDASRLGEVLAKLSH